MPSKTPENASTGLPRHLLEPFFHNKKVRFSVLPTDAGEKRFGRTGLLEVALHTDETPYLRVSEQDSGPSGRRTYHGIVRSAMLAKMKWDDTTKEFYADRDVTDFDSSSS